jgi:hypothetical protein
MKLETYFHRIVNVFLTLKQFDNIGQKEEILC